MRPPLLPMEARVAEVLPGPLWGDEVGAWAYEPKWDGFRVLGWSSDVTGEPRLDSRNGKPLLRYFPELREALLSLPAGTVVDGEMVIVKGGRLDFDALSLRLHPAASRIRKLAAETPARIIAFDLPACRGKDLRRRPFTQRRAELEQLLSQLSPPWHLSPSTVKPVVAERWFREFESAGCDGIVAKRLHGPYLEGQREMIKVKHRRTVDCVVGGYRIHKGGVVPGVGSLLLGLYDPAGRLHFMGHCAGFSDRERRAIYDRLQTLRTTAESFHQTARRPGAESRWAAGKDLSWIPVEPVLVCEVSYVQLTHDRFRHGARFERWRPDKDPRECTMEQLARPEGPRFEQVVAA